MEVGLKIKSERCVIRHAKGEVMTCTTYGIRDCPKFRNRFTLDIECFEPVMIE